MQGESMFGNERTLLDFAHTVTGLTSHTDFTFCWPSSPRRLQLRLFYWVEGSMCMNSPREKTLSMMPAIAPVPWIPVSSAMVGSVANGHGDGRLTCPVTVTLQP